MRPRRNLSIVNFRSIRGITLLELLVAITLVAILSALIYPSFGEALSSLRMRGAARQLISACRFAKWESVARRQPYYLAVDLEKNVVGVASQSQQVIKEIELPPSIRIFQAQKISEGGPADATQFFFFPNGTAESGAITLRDERGVNLRIVIDLLTGDAKIEEP